jgi:NADPH:quinone reductase-like Zn-dependent oxidoreductase
MVAERKSKSSDVTFAEENSAMRAAAPLVASGALHVPVTAVYPLSRIREAVAHLLRGGKILLEVQKLN